jgi:hypothetical protein
MWLKDVPNHPPQKHLFKPRLVKIGNRSDEVPPKNLTKTSTTYLVDIPEKWEKKKKEPRKKKFKKLKKNSKKNVTNIKYYNKIYKIFLILDLIPFVWDTHFTITNIESILLVG